MRTRRRGHKRGEVPFTLSGRVRLSRSTSTVGQGSCDGEPGGATGDVWERAAGRSGISTRPSRSWRGPPPRLVVEEPGHGSGPDVGSVRDEALGPWWREMSTLTRQSLPLSERATMGRSISGSPVSLLAGSGLQFVGPRGQVETDRERYCGVHTMPGESNKGTFLCREEGTLYRER